MTMDKDGANATLTFLQPVSSRDANTAKMFECGPKM
jgi:hypothetical protein